jgi:hypothetical protein
MGHNSTTKFVDRIRTNSEEEHKFLYFQILLLIPSLWLAGAHRVTVSAILFSTHPVLSAGKE